MDVEKWYPNTIPAPTGKCIEEMFINSNLKIYGIDYDRVAKYLGIFFD